MHEPWWDPVADARPADDPWPQVAWPPAPGTALRGRVVELSPTHPDRDAAGLFHALDHDAVWEHVAGRPADAAAMRALLESRVADPAWFPWTVRLRQDQDDLTAGTVVGTTSYLELSPHDARAEIGATSYTPAVWGTDVNPECKLLLLAYAFEQAGFGRVQLKTDVRNHRSQQAIARLGATYEGTLRRYQRRSDGTVRDTVLFSITAEEWPAVRDALVRRLSAG